MRVDSGLIERLRTPEALLHAEPERLFKRGRVRLTEALRVGIERIYQMAYGGCRLMVLIEILSKPVAVSVALISSRKAC